MSRAPHRGALAVAPIEVESGHAHGGSLREALPGGHRDTGLYRLVADKRDSLYAVNLDWTQEGAREGASYAPNTSSTRSRPIPDMPDPFDEWSVDASAAGATLGRIATPGAWAAAAIVVFLVLALLFVSPALAGANAAISNYSDIALGSSGPAVQNVIDSTSPVGGVAAEPAPVQLPSGQPQPQSQPHDGTHSVIGAPSLSVAQIESVLAKYGSPAQGLGQKLYDLGVRYGIDPAYALAFFVHESGCGTQGVARFTLSLGNIRWTPGWADYSGYRKYDSWEAGMEDWYKLITDLYINTWGLRTVDAIIPVYAPSSDGNNPSGYIASVKWMVDSWRGR